MWSIHSKHYIGTGYWQTLKCTDGMAPQRPALSFMESVWDYMRRQETWGSVNSQKSSGKFSKMLLVKCAAKCDNVHMNVLKAGWSQQAKNKTKLN